MQDSLIRRPPRLMPNYSAIRSKDDCLFSLDFGPQDVSGSPPTVAPVWIAISIINGLTSPVIFFTNLLVVWTVLENKRLRGTSYNILIAILAFSDLLVGLAIQPVFVSLIVCLLLDCTSICQLTIAFYMLSSIWCGWSLATLAVISVERYLAIEHPLYYTSTVIIQKILIATAVSGTIMILTVLVFRLQLDESYEVRQIPVAINVSICCLIIIFCVGKVYHTVRCQTRAITAQKAAVSQQEQTEKAKTRLKELRRYFTLGIIFFASIVLYLPALLTKIIGASLGKDSTLDFKYISQFIWITCIYLQSLVNPLIVSLRLSHIRRGVLKKFSYVKNISKAVISASEKNFI